jgi:hypothetical protein
MIETPDSPTQRIKSQNQRMMEEMIANARGAGRPPPPPLPVRTDGGACEINELRWHQATHNPSENPA